MTTPLAAPAPPAADEYAAYYAGYVVAAAADDVMRLLRAQAAALRAACGALDADGARFRYAPGKWSVKEVIGHIADTERIFQYRLLRIARGDTTPLPGFDENAYVAAAGSDAHPLDELLREFAAVRGATLALVHGLDAAAWARRGTASGAEVSARAVLYILAGHAEHHLRILRERYLSGVDA
jgi:uncharacterized damage-inducible protein DinB